MGDRQRLLVLQERAVEVAACPLDAAHPVQADAHVAQALGRPEFLRQATGDRKRLLVLQERTFEVAACLLDVAHIVQADTHAAQALGRPEFRMRAPSTFKPFPIQGARRAQRPRALPIVREDLAFVRRQHRYRNGRPSNRLQPPRHRAYFLVEVVNHIRPREQDPRPQRRGVGFAGPVRIFRERELLHRHAQQITALGRIQEDRCVRRGFPAGFVGAAQDPAVAVE